MKETRLSSEQKPRDNPFGAAKETLQEGGLSRRDGDKQSAIGEAEARVRLFNSSKGQLGLGLLIDNISTITKFF